MEKNMDPTVSGLSIDKNGRPGCLWGVLHVLRNYQWHSVKKMMPSKKFSVRRHVGGLRYSRLKSSSQKSSEARGSVDGKVDDVEETSYGSPTKNKSGQIHMKNVGAEDTSKEHDDSTHENTWDQLLLNAPEVPISCCSGCEMCSTTTSMENLTHSQLDELGRQLLDNALLQHNLERAKEAFSRQKSLNVKESDVADYQSKEVLDALRMLNTDNELYQKALLDSNYALAHHLQALQASNAKRELTNSLSLPREESSSRNSTKLTKVNSLKKEGGTFGDNVNNIPKQDEASSDIGQTSTSTPSPPVELKKRRFKDIKQKIKKAIKDSRKERYRISMDAIFHKMPYGSKFSKVHKEMIDKWKESVKDKKKKVGPKNTDEMTNSTPIEKGRHSNIRRTKSLNESLDKYAQLFESSFGNETKTHHSGSLKLANKTGSSASGSGSKAFGRVLSLPNLESYCSPQCYESVEAFSSGIPTRGLADSSTGIRRVSTKKQKPIRSVSLEVQRKLDAFVENAKQENLVKEENIGALNSDQPGLMLDPTHSGLVTQDEMVNDLDQLTSKEGNSISQNEQELSSENNSNIKQAQPSPISVLDSCAQEKISSPTKLFVSGEADPEVKSSQLLVDELNSFESQDDQFVMDSLTEVVVKAEFEKVKLLQHVRVDKKDEADFNYVRDVLKLSGFSGNEHLGTWHSSAQPVDPSLFEEVEISSPLKSDHSGEDGNNSYDHHLLFDIINEVLLEISDRSFTYWPRPLSCNCHIRPLPKGCHVLNEVWGIISWYLNSQPEFEPLDYLVVRDLSKNDGWMNLQFESECVGLELEEMILDDLLDEVIPA